MKNARFDMAKVERLAVVGVMGSGASRHPERSHSLGQWLAKIDVHLLCGGGTGVMAAVSEAFATVSPRKGRVIGVVPGKWENDAYTSNVGYPNEWIEIPIFTHLPYSGEFGMRNESRNHINVLTSDVVIVLPGSAGTASEARLAVRYRTPTVAWLDDRSDVTGLPADVPVVKDLGDVKKFIAEHAGIPNG